MHLLAKIVLYLTDIIKIWHCLHHNIYMYVYCDLFYCLCFKHILVSAPGRRQDSSAETCGSYVKDSTENYRVVHVLVLHELFAKKFLILRILYIGYSYLILFLRATVLTTNNSTSVGTSRDLLRA